MNKDDEFTDNVYPLNTKIISSIEVKDLEYNISPGDSVIQEYSFKPSDWMLSVNGKFEIDGVTVPADARWLHRDGKSIPYRGTLKRSKLLHRIIKIVTLGFKD